jgi:hypothetical protein
VRAARRHDGLLAGQLGAAIHAQGAGGVHLAPGRLAAAVEHVVGAVVHQQRAAGGGLARQHGGRIGIDAPRQLGLARPSTAV